MAVAPSLPAELTTKFSQLQRHLRGLALLRGLGMVCMVMVGAFFLGLLIDWQFNLPGAGRLVVLLSLALVALGSVGFWLIRPLVRPMNMAELASLVEQANPALRARLSAMIELNDPNIPEEHKGSALMRELLTKQAVSSAGVVEFTESVPSDRSFKLAGMGMVAVLLLLVPMFLFGSTYKLSINRLFSPFENLASVSNLYFEIEDGNRTVATGTDVEIRAIPKFRHGKETLPDTIELHRVLEGGDTDTRILDYVDQEGIYQTRISDVFESFDYHVESAGATSEQFHITAIPAPEVAKLELEVTAPPYTGLPAKSYDGLVGEVTVFEGSTLTFQLTFNKPVETAEFAWEKLTEEIEGQPARNEHPALGGELELAEDKKSATLVVTIRESHSFEVKLTDDHELTNADIPHRIVVTSDAPPELAVVNDGRNIQARPTDVVPIQVKASDDIGVGALELHFGQVGHEKTIVPLEKAKLGVTELEHIFKLDLEQLGLPDGTVVQVKIRAADERPVPGPNEVWSQEMTISVLENAAAPGHEAVAARQENMHKALTEIRQALSRIKRKSPRWKQTLTKQKQRENRSRKTTNCNLWLEKNENLPSDWKPWRNSLVNTLCLPTWLRKPSKWLANISPKPANKWKQLGKLLREKKRKNSRLPSKN